MIGWYDMIDWLNLFVGGFIGSHIWLCDWFISQLFIIHCLADLFWWISFRWGPYLLHSSLISSRARITFWSMEGGGGGGSDCAITASLMTVAHSNKNEI